MHAVLASSPDANAAFRLKIGQTLEFQLTEQGELASLQASSTVSKPSRWNKPPRDTYSKEQVKPEVSTVYARGEIDSSLFLAAKRAGLSHNLTMDLANVFGYDIDFALDIRKGDSFEVIYEEDCGRSARRYRQYPGCPLYQPWQDLFCGSLHQQDGTTSYYNADGTSMRKAFIRTPVDFARISSRFSMAASIPF